MVPTLVMPFSEATVSSTVALLLPHTAPLERSSFRFGCTRADRETRRFQI